MDSVELTASPGVFAACALPTEMPRQEIGHVPGGTSFLQLHCQSPSMNANR
jgi:hypothetical protein